MPYRKGVSALILQNQKILLIKREQNPYKNKWTLPGGKLEEGETIDQALKREILEETGYNIQCTNQMLFYPIQKHKFLLVTKVCHIIDQQQPKENIIQYMMDIQDFNQLRSRQCTPYLQVIVSILLQEKYQ